MGDARVLVVFYSRSGVTRRIALALAGLLDAEIEEIGEPRARSGPFGYLRSVVEAVKQRAAAILPAQRDPAAYDLVLIGTPVWAGSISSPVRAYLNAMRDRMPRVAFFCSLATRGSDAAFEQMRMLAGKSPLGECAVTARDAKHGEYSSRLANFAARLELHLAEARGLAHP